MLNLYNITVPTIYAKYANFMLNMTFYEFLFLFTLISIWNFFQNNKYIIVSEALSKKIKNTKDFKILSTPLSYDEACRTLNFWSEQLTYQKQTGFYRPRFIYMMEYKKFNKIKI